LGLIGRGSGQFEEICGIFFRCIFVLNGLIIHQQPADAQQDGEISEAGGDDSGRDL